jgi:hypothetical protein
MADVSKRVWRYPCFSEFEIRVLFPDITYLHPGEEVSDGVVVRDFDELGLRPRIFRIENDDIIQLLPVEITKDGITSNDIWSATISFVSKEKSEI